MQGNKMTTSEAQPSPMDALPGAEQFFAAPASPKVRNQALEAAKKRTEALLQVDPDYRLALLESPPWNFTTDHLRQVNRVLDEFLDAASRGQIRDLAAQCAEKETSPDATAKQWFTEMGCSRLLQLLDQTDLPDRMIVACCAWLETHDVSHGAYLLHQSRTMPQTGFADFKQTPEEQEADLRFVNAT